jgi:GT2 family glycosyltransferase
VVTPDALIDVVVPTYRRPGLLVRCLEAIAAQQFPATRVVVVVRADDDVSKRVASEAGAARDGWHVIEVEVPGVVAAMAAGVAATTSPMIAFTDDDAQPRPDWLGGIVRHFDDPGVGGVGGRDVIPGQEEPLTTTVGRFSRLGKPVGNHHLGTGPAREVDVLKGVSMAFRAQALALPAPGVLRGDGAEVDFEVLTCGWARRQGWRLIYDPALLVDHEGGPRTGADQRTGPAPQAVFDAAYNSIVAATATERYPPARRIAYALIRGSHDRPGVMRAIVALGRGEWEVVARLWPAIAGRISGLCACRSLRASVGANVVTATVLRGE